MVVCVRVCVQLHLKFCYEAVLKHAEVLLQRHGITSATYSKNTSTAASKVRTHISSTGMQNIIDQTLTIKLLTRL